MRFLRAPGCFLKSQKGTSTVIFTAAFTVIVVCTALVIDIGMVVLEKARLSATIDAAALAGAQELSGNPDNAKNMAENYILKNSDPLKHLDIVADPVAKTIEVKGTKGVNYFFARLFGNDGQDITASATAKIENIESLKGARPLAVVQQTFIYGDLYTLKVGGGDGTTGNYAAISLGSTGSSTYSYNMLNGYSGTISVGDIIQTETGNMAGPTETSVNQLIHQCNHTPLCTYNYYNKNCSRIIFIPIVNTLTVNGRDYVEVMGFGTFFLEGASTSSGKAEVKGRFITYNLDGETSTEVADYGTYNIRLIK